MSDQDVMVKEDKRPTVCVDLDGVLNLYDGWKGEDHFADPRPGAAEFMGALGEHYKLVVLTTRDPHATWDWLTKHRIRCYTVTSTKPPAVAYIDDRAIPFEGSFDGLLERVRTFKAHWERPTAQPQEAPRLTEREQDARDAAAFWRPSNPRAG